MNGADPRRRAVVIAAVAVACLVAVIAAIAVATDRTDPAPHKLTSARAADRACERADGFARAVERDAPYTEAVRTLRQAIADAKSAADRDNAHTALHSGLLAVELSIRRNDPTAARVGIRVVRAECDRLDKQ